MERLGKKNTMNGAIGSKKHDAWSDRVRKTRRMERSVQENRHQAHLRQENPTHKANGSENYDAWSNRVKKHDAWSDRFRKIDSGAIGRPRKSSHREVNLGKLDA